MSFNNVGHLITSTITILQHFATLNHTSPNYTSLHLSTLHFLSFTLHFALEIQIYYKYFSFILFNNTRRWELEKKVILNTLTLSTGCSFYRVSEQGSCDGISRALAFCEIQQRS